MPAGQTRDLRHALPISSPVTRPVRVPWPSPSLQLRQLEYLTEGGRGVQLSSKQIPRPAYPHPLQGASSSTDRPVSKWVEWGFCTIFSLLQRFKNQSFLCSVRGERFLWVSPSVQDFSLMEKEKSFPHSDMPSHEVIIALIYVLRRAPLVWSLHQLPTYVGTYKLWDLCVYRI